MWGTVNGNDGFLPDYGANCFHSPSPTLITTPSSTRIERVAVGDSHVLALTHTGAVLTFGCGGSGVLGHGDEAWQFVPKVIEALRNVRVMAIAAGYKHSMVLTDEGEVLSFGYGGYGQLGHGDQADQLVPKVISGLQVNIAGISPA